MHKCMSFFQFIDIDIMISTIDIYLDQLKTTIVTCAFAHEFAYACGLITSACTCDRMFLFLVQFTEELKLVMYFAVAGND
jgi:hypothetical protein